MEKTYILIGKIVVWYGVVCAGAAVLGLLWTGYIYLDWKIMEFKHKRNSQPPRA